MTLQTSGPCVFCGVVTGTEPATIYYQDDQVMVIKNLLHWVPVMLLVLPKIHMTQEEFWLDIQHAAQVAVTIGKEQCPGGFRLLSNFGHDALQTQEHGHIHILGGVRLGRYAVPPPE